ncbi:conserved hypothetical protein [Beutenbergia cavernae DSM 12333]|uniref:AbiEi antitoxin N-terminal domain-containing protein n=1 Tax=Beutenbergia cavernae (strain ATCC BAA-8 / DSM 12333 / CCUG 43141 / JCM 11478 / NBRC 16432 / NCIMB 13614 / HKI 0122) TaxID=471853 RepID=C5C5C4_BEUC1|nr:type IV toxin-antitoxin system AbiEi family antitoxin domain-containing protein [Beutenbergia cavernae]ACQ82264.1 conserved hypothetical protein [Beutenbergia cavernae DSM 12333]
MRTLAPTPQALLDAARLQFGLVTTAQCEAAGITRNARAVRVARGDWVRPTRGVYDLAPGAAVDMDPGWRRRRGAVLGLLAYGPEAVAVGTSALALHGLWGLPLRSLPQVALPSGDSRLSRDGIRVRRFTVPRVTRTGEGYAVAPVGLALAQAIPELDRDHAVALLDSALNLERIDGADIAKVRDVVRHRRGASRAAGWWDLVDARSESTYETFARLECHDAGIAPDELQVPMVLPDGRRARGDLGWQIDPRTWLLAEIEGEDAHAARRARRKDQRRQNGLTISGEATVLRYDPADVWTGVIPAEVKEFLRSRRRRGA